MDRIDALRLFRDVAEAGSFSAVARQRSVSNSTVTLAVQQLEEELGKRLMTRSTRQLVLTHEGQSLLAEARRIVEEWDALLESVRDDGPLAGPIRVTATNDFGRKRVRFLLDAFQNQHPAVSITLILSDTSLDLIEERIDVAIRNGPLQDSTMRARLLLRNQRVVCASPRYWSLRGKPVHPSDLADHNCLVLTRPGGTANGVDFSGWRQGAEYQGGWRPLGERRRRSAGVGRRGTRRGVQESARYCG